MASQLIDERRVSALNDADPHPNADFVLYAMEASQRAQDNHALEHAVRCANDLGKPVVVAFPLFGDAFGAGRRQKRFMLEGLRDVSAGLARRNIRFVMTLGEMAEQTLKLADRAALVVLDRGYLRHQRDYADRIADDCPVRVEQVETNVVVPVDEASEKREHAARTIRPRILRKLDDFLVELRTTPLEKASLDLKFAADVSNRLEDIDGLLDELDLPDNEAGLSPLFTGGEHTAKRRFGAFLEDGFQQYSAHRNQPQTSDCSYMSMYLHYGQVSPIWLVQTVRDAGAGGEDDRKDFEEELVIRRELAMNFCAFSDDYDRYSALPNFARITLDDHRGDEREHLYTPAEFEDARTHDPYWNAAMRELRYTGYMHNYMRMYWGKKVLEWSASPEQAFETLVKLNDRYFLDGRDPNSYTGVSWCFGTHDRGWTERPVYGKVRYMNANGLKRKCDPDAYVAKVDALVQDVGGPQPDPDSSREAGSLFG
ncbi:MAG: deoxyribodipyrimidine photo-lyase [Planctomycetota bacterium]